MQTVSLRIQAIFLGIRTISLGIPTVSHGTQNASLEIQTVLFQYPNFSLTIQKACTQKIGKKNRELRGLCLLSNASKTYLLPESAWQVIVKNRTEIRTRRQGDAQIKGERRVNITNLIFVLQRETMISLP